MPIKPRPSARDPTHPADGRESTIRRCHAIAHLGQLRHRTVLILDPAPPAIALQFGKTAGVDHPGGRRRGACPPRRGAGRRPDGVADTIHGTPRWTSNQRGDCAPTQNSVTSASGERPRQPTAACRCIGDWSGRSAVLLRGRPTPTGRFHSCCSCSSSPTDGSVIVSGSPASALVSTPLSGSVPSGSAEPSAAPARSITLCSTSARS